MLKRLKQSLKKLKWQKGMFKRAEMMKQDLSGMSSDKTQTLEELKWQKKMFKGAWMRSSGLQRTSNDKKQALN